MHTRTINIWHLVCLGLFLATAGCAQPPTVVGIKPTDRVLFVGDSITGQGGNGGFVVMMRAAYKEVHPNSTATFIPLGGSGQTVGSWGGMEKSSRGKDAKDNDLDVKGFGLKSNLDQPADVVVIMLGMNDILCPYMGEKTADYDNWAAQYTTLLTALRERLKSPATTQPDPVKPRIIALATFTNNTDDMNSPKNIVRAELNKRVVEIARANGCVLLPVGQAVEALLYEGRTLQPDFHVTNDLVHPNQLGHAAIAQAMLAGLGETAAAKKVEEKYLTPFFNDPKLYPALSYTLELVATPLVDSQVTYKLNYWWTPVLTQKIPISKVTLQAPADWTVTPAMQMTSAGSFTITGTPDKLVNVMTLRAQSGELSKELTINIPAPWLIGSGIVSYEAWPGQKFNVEGSKFPFEAALIKGEGLGEPQKINNGETMKWKRYSASVNYVGGSDPGSVDLTQVSFARTFEAAYCARWIYSPTARPLNLEIGANTFAGSPALTIYMNEKQCFSSVLEHTTVTTTLNKGWNLLLVRSNHLTWQWQFFCKLSGAAGDDLNDLRFSASSIKPETK